MVPTNLKLSIAFAPIVLLIVIVSYVYSLWIVEVNTAKQIPQEATGVMLRDLLAYHRKRGSFPKTLKEIEGVVWEKKETRIFSANDRGISHKNYYYFFTRIDHNVFSLWAIPTGNYREDAPTFFMYCTPKICRRWKGPALTFDTVTKIRSSLSSSELNVLGLSEQETLKFSATN